MNRSVRRVLAVTAVNAGAFLVDTAEGLAGIAQTIAKELDPLLALDVDPEAQEGTWQERAGGQEA